MDNNFTDNQEDKAQLKDAKPMAVLCYLGPLVLLPYFTHRKDPFVRFHVGQGMVLLAIEICVWILSALIWVFWPIIQLINLGVFILSIIGIVNAIHGRQQVLPVVGKFSDRLPI